MAVKRKDLKTLKINGRKYVVIKQVANRQGHSTSAIKLLKRAGKAHWFVAVVTHVGIKGLEDTSLVRFKGFWEALADYASNAEAIGVILGEAEQEPDLYLTEEEKAKLVARVEGQANA